MTRVATLRRYLVRVRQAVSSQCRRDGIQGTWLAEVIAELPEPARTIYLLSARDDLPIEVIAGHLGLPVTIVERELANALLLIEERDNIVASSGADE